MADVPDDLLKQLQSNLSEARSKLKLATESLEKLHGQHSYKLSLQSRKRGAIERDSENGSTVNNDDAGIPAKRAYGTQASVSHRISVPSNRQEQTRPAVPLAEFQRSRRAAIKEQAAAEDGELRARNRRMLGLMLGTLKQFSAAERDRERQESYQQRREVEQRVEESVMREKERLQKDAAELTGERRRCQAEIAALETQVGLVESHKAWRRAAEQLRGSIRTLADSHPHRLYYRPRIFCDRAQRRRELSAKQIDTEIADRDRRLHQDVDLALREAVEKASAAVAKAGSDLKEEATDCDGAGTRPEPVKRLLSSVAVVPPQQQQQQQQPARQVPVTVLE